MAGIAWSEDLAIDDSQIDFQHRQLIDCMACLENALVTADPRLIAESTPFLRMYAQVHFADEERVLQLVGWPRLAEHRALHEAFRTRLGELEGALARGEFAAGASLLGFLAGWLQNHIRGADRQFAAEVRALRARK